MPSTQAVEDVKKYIPQLAGTAHDALLELIETRARATIDAYYRLKFGPGWPGFADFVAATDKVVFGWDEPLLWLPPHKIGTVTNIRYAGLSSGSYVSTGVVSPATWYEDQTTGGVLYPGWTWGNGTYLVSAQWGIGPMPEYVYQVLLELMINIWRGKDRAQTAEGLPIQFNTKLTEDQKMTLSAVLLPWQAKVGTIKIYRATL